MGSHFSREEEVKIEKFLEVGRSGRSIPGRGWATSREWIGSGALPGRWISAFLSIIKEDFAKILQNWR